LSWRRRLLVGSLRGLFRTLSHWEIQGLQNLPKGGPLIVVFNHVAHLDGPLVIASLPWEVEVVSLSDLLAVPVVGQLLRMYGVIQVHRDVFDRQVVRQALQVLAEGKVLALAPEARQSPTGAMEHGREGAAYLALRSGAPVLPIGVTGTETVPSMLKHLRRPHVRVNIGASLHLDGPLAHGAARQAQLQAAHGQIMRHIAHLLPAHYQGVYAQ
jgi:1-acyl-sn-glycerol-3-phosphate acyltransferase